MKIGFVGLGNGMVLSNAIAGSMSVRPRLAGTASGLGGALMIGGGAALSAIATAVTGGDSGHREAVQICPLRTSARPRRH